MNDIVNYSSFVIACIVLAMTPGNDTIYLLTRTLAQGRMAAMVSLLGITLGLFVHIAAVSFGLAQVIAQSPTLFGVLQYGGAAYLVYLAWQMWQAPPIQFSGSLNTEKNHVILLKQGFITNLLNPKIIIFFLTLLPQFVRKNSEMPSVLPFLWLGMTFVMIGVIWAMMVIMIAAPFGNWLRRQPSASQIMNRVSGTIFVVLAMKLAFF